MAAAAQQNHVDNAPDSPPPSAASSRLVNHVTSPATTMPGSLSRPSSLVGNGTEQSVQQSMNSNHFPGNCFIVARLVGSDRSDYLEGASLCDQNILNVCRRQGIFVYFLCGGNDHCGSNSLPIMFLAKEIQAS